MKLNPFLVIGAVVLAAALALHFTQSGAPPTEDAEDLDRLIYQFPIILCSLGAMLLLVGVIIMLSKIVSIVILICGIAVVVIGAIGVVLVGNEVRLQTGGTVFTGQVVDDYETMVEHSGPMQQYSRQMVQRHFQRRHPGDTISRLCCGGFHRLPVGEEMG